MIRLKVYGKRVFDQLANENKLLHFSYMYRSSHTEGMETNRMNEKSSDKDKSGRRIEKSDYDSGEIRNALMFNEN